MASTPPAIIIRQPPQIQTMKGLYCTRTIHSPLGSCSPIEMYRSRSKLLSTAASVIGLLCTR